MKRFWAEILYNSTINSLIVTVKPNEIDTYMHDASVHPMLVISTIAALNMWCINHENHLKYIENHLQTTKN